VRLSRYVGAMNFSVMLTQELSDKHLLKHRWYQAWSCGQLSLDALRIYARQYYHHVGAFPRYVSATHSHCLNIEDRQALLENLIDEERGESNHPELWLRFAEGLGETRENVMNEKLSPETANLVSTFDGLCRSSYEEGLGALFAYEHQVPEVAAAKINGLEKFYGINSYKAVEFFRVHMTADVYHTQAMEKLLDKLSRVQQEKAGESAKTASKALWSFLDGMQYLN